MRMRVLFVALVLPWLLNACASTGADQIHQQLAVQAARSQVLAAGIRNLRSGGAAAPYADEIDRAFAQARQALQTGQFLYGRNDYGAARRETERARVDLDLVQAALRAQGPAAKRRGLASQNAALKQQIAALETSVKALESRLHGMQ